MKISITTLPAFGDIEIELGDLTVVCGSNGTGKSSLIRAIGTSVKGSKCLEAKRAQDFFELAFQFKEPFGSTDFILILDTPELGLHPENQRRMARLIAKIVNLGVKVVVATNSDYIVKELNTLIMFSVTTAYLMKLAKKEGYDCSEFICPNRVKAYNTKQIEVSVFQLECNEVTESGIEVVNFDAVIEAMNRIQEAIIWGE
jgi:ABC-type Mn2+/Zn2+ transport system ATPase subunit